MAEDLKFMLFTGSAAIFAVVLAVCIYIINTTTKFPRVLRYPQERFFQDYKTTEEHSFPTPHDKQTINLSVIIPAYNEQDRLPTMMDECLEFLEKRTASVPNFKYEIIVVSDGSIDDTVFKAAEYTRKLSTEKVRVLKLTKNRGKGGAVRLGVLNARGALILFADADGATRFSDITKLEDIMETKLDGDYKKDMNLALDKGVVVIGSRAHMMEDAVATRSFFRTILMYGFHFCVWLFTVRDIRDTQCGFKLFTRHAAFNCFGSLHIERWAFDVELLYIAQRLKYDIGEVPVQWTEVDGSKVTPVLSWIQMGVDLVLIWLRYLIGAWSIAAAEVKDFAKMGYILEERD